MRICMVAEGSYPYITGGVSSWIHSLIQSMPQHEFVIYAIGAEEKNRGKFKYELPPNVVEVKESFLDVFMREEDIWGKSYRLTPEERQSIQSLIAGTGTDWNTLFKLLRDERWESSTEFLMSRDYFDALSELSRERYSQLPFRELFWTVRSMLLPLMQLLREPIPEADLYHTASTGYAGIIASFGKTLYGRKMLLTEHGIYSREREEEIIKAEWVQGYFKDLWIQFFYGLSRCAYDYADRVITLFNRNREIAIELGCPEDKISIVPNGVKLGDYAALPGRSKGEEDSRLHIGAVVRVVPIKDIKTMLGSFAIVKREIPEAVFTIMGPTDEDTEYYEECLEMVELLGLKDVEFTGSVNVKEYLGKMDIIALTSISEGQPLSVLEAMAAGKPCVTTDVGSCRELLQGRDDGIGPSGLVAPVMNEEEIAANLTALGRNRKMREEMGRNGRLRIEREYTHDSFIARYENLYRSLARGGGAPWQE
ncbi:glycosyl transferase [Cohnella xylanilytica]|uniref:GT4 family glycosyltransferase PelF n=1 Tax=Cohnella xylanilytica TaxID=557555 RepID=UPI001B1D52B7|nr:GT4 family glycosyltransferase PelF [Cohnella xylanilytica]GIO12906.1 glycosyl transferase [Cohnella xylanilytica]